jgi:uncharacterized DUF497 family protein
MEFEWDEAKRLSNLAKHDIDFVDAQQLFDGRLVLTVPSRRSIEPQFTTTGPIDVVLFTVVWTSRGDNIRLISARRASHAEDRAYRALHG